MDKKRIVSIIGTGNVATHLFKAFSECESHDLLDVIMVNSRSLEGLPLRSDVILISVKDDVIGYVVKGITGRGRVIAHTSGSVSMECLKGCADNYGVFYPLQTFSKNRELKYKEIPFFIEGNDDEATLVLTQLARMVSDHVFEADSDKRKRLHVAAVFACNFSNHLVALADKLLSENGMDYKVLLPLLRETVGKLDVLSPLEAQTGPAVREDKTVMSSHLDMLSGHPEWQVIYKLLSESVCRMKS